MDNELPLQQASVTACVHIDPFEEQFDPQAALTRPISEIEHVLRKTPFDYAVFRRAQPLDNICACSSVQDAPFRLLKHQRPPQRKEEIACAARAKPKKENAYSPKPLRNALSQMHNKSAADGGPASLLHKLWMKQQCIRVVLRETHRIRGVVTGKLSAFDKHFNMVLLNACIQDLGKEKRHVKQLFIRGEHVVLISADDSACERG